MDLLTQVLSKRSGKESIITILHKENEFGKIILIKNQILAIDYKRCMFGLCWKEGKETCFEVDC